LSCNIQWKRYKRTEMKRKDMASEEGKNKVMKGIKVNK
jgi:hypothetical protein